MTPAALRILLVDDHPVVREGVRAMLAPEPDIEVAGEAGSGDEAVTLARSGGYDVILMDLRMPGTDGVAAIGQILARDPAARIVVLTTYETDADILRAVEAGAAGYLLKDSPRAEVANAIRVAARGETVLAPSVAQKLLGRVRTPAAPIEQLTDRELKVLTLVASGTTNREAAKQLFISEATVKTHLLHAYAKLGVRDRAAAVAEAYKRGLLG